MYKVLHYIDHRGAAPLDRWLRQLNDPLGKVAIIRRLNRLELGQVGDHKPCRQGVWELRINTGPGYRVYYAWADSKSLLLLCGGSKRRQSRDIERALLYWRHWRNREHH
ncbi:MAG: addiction module protein [Alcanivorax sp.]|nr:addiction module protein [Alcanivorax sp.]MBG11838.1 addiction module protein [Alcanivorax sp.]HAD64205.1 addiction module protein [Alcanivorax sp.]HAI25705.1 addiction module protein [Alcanivorax sp.]HAV68733.1 addiction module protein [Alcanivorax sp.]